MLFAWADRVRREQLPPGIDLHQAQEQLFSRWYGRPETGKALADCPYALWMMLMATLWLAPLLVALMTFDAVSGDLQRGTLRFWALRARRSSCLLGKALGAWLAVLVVSFAMNVIVWVTAAAVGHQGILYIVGWGLRFFAIVVPVTAAWCALAVLIGAQIKTPIVSLLTICAAFFALWVLRVAAGLTGYRAVAWAYPNAYETLLISPDPANVGRGLLGTGLIAAGSLLLATLSFERRDL
jgi:ABC-type transport system involved in multi-copper enzyme maturation permease subunit